MWAASTAYRWVSKPAAHLAVWRAAKMVGQTVSCLVASRAVKWVVWREHCWVFRQAGHLAVLMVAWKAWLVVAMKVAKRVAWKVSQKVAQTVEKWAGDSVYHLVYQ